MMDMMGIITYPAGDGGHCFLRGQFFLVRSYPQFSRIQNQSTNPSLCVLLGLEVGVGGGEWWGWWGCGGGIDDAPGNIGPFISKLILPYSSGRCHETKRLQQQQQQPVARLYNTRDSHQICLWPRPLYLHLPDLVSHN